jgi:hypothetical protein
MGRGGDWEMGRWGDGEMGGQGDKNPEFDPAQDKRLARQREASNPLIGEVHMPTAHFLGGSLG